MFRETLCDYLTRLGSDIDIIQYRKTMSPFLKKRIEKDAIYV